MRLKLKELIAVGAEAQHQPYQGLQGQEEVEWSWGDGSGVRDWGSLREQCLQGQMEEEGSRQGRVGGGQSPREGQKCAWLLAAAHASAVRGDCADK